MDNAKLIKAALKWASKGVPVFPCNYDKTPMTANGHLDASIDPDRVSFLFSDCPEGTMIGARMGKESGLFAADFDLYKPGAEDYMRSLIDKGVLNETQTHLTRSGGLHFIYRSEVQPNCKPAIGVEVKGEGGYIIVPPSSGYSIEREGITQAHPKLVNELLAAQKSSSSSSVDRLKRSILSGQSFHDPMAQIAARRSAQGWSIERVQRELLDVLAASAARSPTHPRHERWAALVEDRQGELSRIVGTGHDKYNSNAKTEKVRENVENDTIADLGKHSESFFGLRGNDSEREKEDNDSGDAEGQSDVVEQWPFEAHGYNAQTSRDIRSQRFVAYPFLAERETVLIAAEPKAGKTAIALTLAAAVATGESITDAIAIAEARPVLYFTLEGARAVELRLEAMRVHAKNNGNPVPDLSKLFIVDRPHNFLDPEQQEINCARIALHSAKCQQEWGVDLGLVVIDTLTKAMPGGDQNSVEDTSQMFELIGKLRSFGVDATIGFLHHLSKQGGVRGSTNIEAEVDVVLGIEKVKNSTDVWLNIRRARSIDEDNSYRWAFRSVDLGETIQGHKLSAPVMELVTAEKGPIPTSGDKVKDSVKWQKINEAIITLGKGQHHVSELVAAMGEWVDYPSGKRPSFDAKSIQTPLQELFEGKFSWAFGDWHITILRKPNENISGIELRFTA